MTDNQDNKNTPPERPLPSGKRTSISDEGVSSQISHTDDPNGQLDRDARLYGFSVVQAEFDPELGKTVYRRVDPTTVILGISTYSAILDAEHRRRKLIAEAEKEFGIIKHATPGSETEMRDIGEIRRTRDAELGGIERLAYFNRRLRAAWAYSAAIETRDDEDLKLLWYKQGDD